MKKFILITILFTSCSVFRHKTENNSSQKDLTVHVAQRRDSLQLSAQAQQIRFLSDDRLELTEIIPQGKFVYKPDSGFRGEAKSIRVYRQRQQRAVAKDTVALSVAAGNDRIALDSAVHERAQQQLEETRKSKPVAVYVYVIAIIGVLFVVAKRVFKW